MKKVLLFVFAFSILFPQKISFGGFIKFDAFYNEPGTGGMILSKIGDGKINLHFVAESDDINGKGNLILCVNSNQANETLSIIHLFNNNRLVECVTEISNVTALTVYGPHFRDKPAICGKMCSALGKSGIDILGISTSISSICCLINDEKITQAESALLKVFKLP